MSQTETSGPLSRKAENGLLIAGATVVGIVLLCGLCAVAVIFILALLGPTIGNVYSGTVIDF